MDTNEAMDDDRAVATGAGGETGDAGEAEREAGEPTADRRRLLAIYLNDQLAAGVAGRELARRSARSNVGSELGATVSAVAGEIAADVETLERMMDRLGVQRRRAKPAMAMLSERLGRLKPNGRMLSYSPLSRFVELDLLVIGIEGKKILWANVRDLAGGDELLPDVDFDELIARAGRQRAELEPHRVEAGRVALRSS